MKRRRLSSPILDKNESDPRSGIRSSPTSSKMGGGDGDTASPVLDDSSFSKTNSGSSNNKNKNNSSCTSPNPHHHPQQTKEEAATTATTTATSSMMYSSRHSMKRKSHPRSVHRSQPLNDDTRQHPHSSYPHPPIQQQKQQPLQQKEQPTEHSIVEGQFDDASSSSPISIHSHSKEDGLNTKSVFATTYTGDIKETDDDNNDRDDYRSKAEVKMKKKKIENVEHPILHEKSKQSSPSIHETKSNPIDAVPNHHQHVNNSNEENEEVVKPNLVSFEESSPPNKEKKDGHDQDHNRGDLIYETNQKKAHVESDDVKAPVSDVPHTTKTATAATASTTIAAAATAAAYTNPSTTSLERDIQGNNSNFSTSNSNVAGPMYPSREYSSSSPSYYNRHHHNHPYEQYFHATNRVGPRSEFPRQPPFLPPAYPPYHQNRQIHWSNSRPTTKIHQDQSSTPTPPTRMSDNPNSNQCHPSSSSTSYHPSSSSPYRPPPSQHPHRPPSWGDNYSTISNNSSDNRYYPPQSQQQQQQQQQQQSYHSSSYHPQHHREEYEQHQQRRRQNLSHQHGEFSSDPPYPPYSPHPQHHHYNRNNHPNRTFGNYDSGPTSSSPYHSSSDRRDLSSSYSSSMIEREYKKDWRNVKTPTPPLPTTTTAVGAVTGATTTGANSGVMSSSSSASKMLSLNDDTFKDSINPPKSISNTTNSKDQIMTSSLSPSTKMKTMSFISSPPSSSSHLESKMPPLNEQGLYHMNSMLDFDKEIHQPTNSSHGFGQYQHPNQQQQQSFQMQHHHLNEHGESQHHHYSQSTSPTVTTTPTTTTPKTVTSGLTADIPEEERINPASITIDDVLLGRGGGTNRHNTRFRTLVSEAQPQYVQSRKKDKTAIAKSIVATIRSRKGRFLKLHVSTKFYVDVGDKQATAKTSQALREGLSGRMREIVKEEK